MQRKAEVLCNGTYIRRIEDRWLYWEVITCEWVIRNREDVLSFGLRIKDNEILIFRIADELAEFIVIGIVRLLQVGCT